MTNSISLCFDKKIIRISSKVDKRTFKVNLFAWRLLQNCIPTTYNLIKIRVLQPNIQFCSSGCGLQEDVDHLLLSCDF